MEKNLYYVVELQKVIHTIEKLKKLIADNPSRLEALNQELKAEEDKLNDEKAQLEAAQKNKREKEGELQLLNAKLSKYKDQSMNVKTNKEYTTILHEIEVCKGEIEKFEEELIQTMYDLDSLHVEVKEEEEIFKREKKRIEGEKEKAVKEAQEAEIELQALEQKRGEFEASLPKDILQEFMKIASIRGGIAVARANDFMCLECKLRLRPQVFITVKSNNVLLTCENCNRFLYWEEGYQTELMSKDGKNEQKAV